MIAEKNRLFFWSVSNGVRSFASQPFKKRVVLQEGRDLMQHQWALELAREQKQGTIIAGLLQGIGSFGAGLFAGGVALYLAADSQKVQKELDEVKGQLATAISDNKKLAAANIAVDEELSEAKKVIEAQDADLKRLRQERSTKTLVNRIWLEEDSGQSSFRFSRH